MLHTAQMPRLKPENDNKFMPLNGGRNTYFWDVCLGVLNSYGSYWILFAQANLCKYGNEKLCSRESAST